MFKRARKAQMSLEYVILVIVVIGAFLVASVYFKRGLSGRWKIAIDDLGDQYDPRLSISFINHVLAQNSSTVMTTHNVSNGFWTHRIDKINSFERRFGSQNILGY